MVLSFRDYTTLLGRRVQQSQAQPPTCFLGLFPKPQTPVGTTLPHLAQPDTHRPQVGGAGLVDPLQSLGLLGWSKRETAELLSRK